MNKLTIDELLDKRLDASRTQTVNVETFLSTDYLNHYNEVIMLVEMLPDMPDVIDMIMEWQPKSYVQHFEDSSLPERATAIDLYHIAPAQFKKQYDEAVISIDKILLTTLDSLNKIDVFKDKEKLQEIVNNFDEVHKYTSVISNTANGKLLENDRDDLSHKITIEELDDILFYDASITEVGWCLETETFNQDDIDALFD